MLTSKFLVYRAHPSQSQIRITSGVALALFILFIAALFFARLPLPRNDAFFPSINIFRITGDLITATLLWAQARVLGSRRLNVLGAGYFYTGLMVVSRTLTFPGAFAPYGLLGATANTSIWLSDAAQAGFCIAILAYAWLGRDADRQPPARPPSHLARGLYVIVPVVAALALTLLATLGEPLLPSLTTSFVRYTPATYLAAAPALLLLIAAIVTLLRGRRSELDLWLLLVLWGWFLETVLANFSFGRFTLGWYAGQLMNMASSQFVLFTLIAETNTLYALSVQQLTAERQDRESRLLTRDAVAAFIAHELRQPLSAILLNAQVMQNSPAGRGEEMAELLADVVACSLRANDMIQSTRAIFRHQPGDKQAVDLGLLLRSTLAMVESSARALDVSVELALERQPKPINANRLQIQQVLLNLFQNAIEALSRVNERRRALTVRCIPSEEDGVTIRVEDNGPGIAQADRERIFDAFFTTRADGSGLGLAITRMVVEAHGGQISVEPLSPFGTAFVIRLPYDGGEAD